MYQNTVGEKNKVFLDGICEIIKETNNKDDIGQSVFATEDIRLIFCMETPVFSSEFYQAGQLGIKPSLCIIIDREEYQGELVIRYMGNKYIIYKTFSRSDGFIELYCEVKKGE